MAKNTISYLISKGGIEPATKQLGGVQGDHNVSTLVFTIENQLWNEIQAETSGDDILACSFQLKNGGGEVMTVSGGRLLSNIVTVDVDEFLTRYGGEAEVTLIISRYSEGVSNELYSFPALLKFKGRIAGARGVEEYQNILSIKDEVEKTAENVQDYVYEAKQYADQTLETKNEVETKLANGDYKGDKGDKGEKGDKGDRGESGGVDTSLFASAIQNTVSGGVLGIKDIGALPHTVKVKLSGEEAENLMPSPYSEFFPYHDNGDGSLTINATIPSDNYYPFFVYHSGGQDLKPIEEGTYTLDLGTATTQMYLEVQLNTFDYSNQKTYQTDSTGKVTFTVGAEDYMEALLLRPTNGTTVENLLIKPMLYKVKESLFDTPTPSTNPDDIEYHGSVAIRAKTELKNNTTYTLQFKCNYAGIGLHHHPLLTDGLRGDYTTTGGVQTITFSTAYELNEGYAKEYIYADGFWSLLSYDAVAPADIEFTDLAISEGNTIVNTNDYSQVKLYRYGVNSSVNKETYTPNADGTVDVPSLSPYMSLVTDKCGLTINATYNLDTKSYVDANKGTVEVWTFELEDGTTVEKAVLLG